MNLYLISRSQSQSNEYDTISSAVVVAESEEEARKIHPCLQGWNLKGGRTWINSEEVIVTLIGKAEDNLSKGKVLIVDYSVG